MFTQTTSYSYSATSTFSSFTSFTTTNGNAGNKIADNTDKDAAKAAQKPEKDNAKNAQNVPDNSATNNANNVDKIEISGGNNNEPVLSQAALNYLDELKQKFGNVDFIIADFSTDKEAQQHLKHGKGEYNAVITPSLLESMAANKDVAEKYENVIASSINNLVDAKSQLNEKVEAGELKEISKNIENFGVSIDDNGEVNYYVLFKNAMPQSSFISDDYNKMIKASSIEELFEILAKMDEEMAKKNKDVDKDKEVNEKDKVANEKDKVEKDKEEKEKENKKIDISA